MQRLGRGAGSPGGSADLGRPTARGPALAGHTPSAGLAGGRTPGGLRPLGVGAQAGAGFRGAGPRSALGPLPNLSRRGGGGASWTALGPVLPEKFGWGGPAGAGSLRINGTGGRRTGRTAAGSA